MKVSWTGPVAQSKLQSFVGSCKDLSSYACTSAAARYCETIGAGTGYATEKSGDTFTVKCFKPTWSKDVAHSVLDNKVGITNVCKVAGIASCWSAASRFCEDLGYTGGIVVERIDAVAGVRCYNGFRQDVFFTRNTAFYKASMSANEVCSLTWTIDQAKILSKTPDVLKSQTYKNPSSVVLYDSFSVSETRTDTSTFSYSGSITLGLSTSVKVGIPLLSSGTVNVSSSITATTSWGTQQSIARTFTSTNSVEVPAKHSIQITASVTNAKLDVPWTASVVTGLGSRKTISGTWAGTSVTDMKVTQKDISNSIVMLDD